MNHFAVQTAEQLPALLKAFRKDSGLTQAQVAASLGVTQQTLSALERNAKKVSDDRLLQLLGILGVEMALRRKETASPASSGSDGGTSGW